MRRFFPSLLQLVLGLGHGTVFWLELHIATSTSKQSHLCSARPTEFCFSFRIMVVHTGIQKFARENLDSWLISYDNFLDFFQHELSLAVFLRQVHDTPLKFMALV